MYCAAISRERDDKNHHCDQNQTDGFGCDDASLFGNDRHKGILQDATSHPHCGKDAVTYEPVHAML